ncbi:Com family DNA-binding transcriptional regulator [Psychrobacter sp. FDAARGOS_221]|uniref:Com family DNA-binding transcriptional regulator n=1 Tax=Psychrobacter sp. FDAARGOS_221 TaxID=1975705 RepID=UPI000BB54052|nr:Com family DNA-binding transcriptional regulator [Psychrobacter sp. FDAARGOS_221]PNK61936.1 Com family DNA-binding transcriptional regulator [Psychrobacter sp. FDAARGOS_221]
MQSIRCKSCNKLLAKARYQQLEIKCPRCKLLNKLSVRNALQEDHESHTIQVKTRGQSNTQAIQQSTNSVCRSKT